MSEIINKSETAYIVNKDGIKNVAKTVSAKFYSLDFAERFMKLCVAGIIDKVFIMSELNYENYYFPDLLIDKVEDHNDEFVTEDFLEDLENLKKEDIENDYQKMIDKIEQTEKKDVWVNFRTDWDRIEKTITMYKFKKRIGVLTLNKEGESGYGG